MSHLSHIEVAEKFGGPGERPNMTALPDGFPSNSPVTQRNSDSTSRRHEQVGMVDHFSMSELKNVLGLVTSSNFRRRALRRISSKPRKLPRPATSSPFPAKRPSRLLSNALKSQRLRPVYEGSFYAIAGTSPAMTALARESPHAFNAASTRSRVNGMW